MRARDKVTQNAINRAKVERFQTAADDTSSFYIPCYKNVIKIGETVLKFIENLQNQASQTTHVLCCTD